MAEESQVAPATDNVLRFQLQVSAPEPLKSLVASGLEIARWQTYQDLTDDVLERLTGEARQQAANIVATEGYFSPKIAVVSDKAAIPWQVRISIEPGQRTRINAVKLRLSGPIERGAGFAGRVAALEEAWRLKVGMPFRQSDWDRAKREAVALVERSRYAHAELAQSEARIDPATHGAELEVTIESGEAVFFGPLEISGLSKYSADVVRGFAAWERGDPYDQERVEVFRRRLIATGYFASVQVEVADDTTRAADAPVKVVVIEAPSRNVELGISYSTDAGWRLQSRYSNARVTGDGLQLKVDLRLDTKTQIAAATLTPRPTLTGWADTYGTRFERTDIQGLVTRELRFDAGRARVEERDQPGFGLTVAAEDKLVAGVATLTRSHAALASVGYTIRHVDNLLSPRAGMLASIQAGFAPPGVSTRSFARIIARTNWYIPLSAATDLTLRAEGGYVQSTTREGIPQAFLFRTGGDTTVRGYALQKLGVREGSAVVGGRVYSVLSAEYTRWVTEDWGIAGFVDAGNAADRLADLHVVQGYGLGARFRSPVGQFRADLAYGSAVKEFRLHLSMGVRF
jgi:translocation and assembly module TamA